MKYYFSSYKIGNEPNKLKEMLPADTRVVYISSALDFAKPEIQKRKQEEDMGQLREIGLDPELLDLREYFGKQKELRAFLEGVDLLYVSGGNVFDLRIAMKLSGFDDILIALSETDMVYAGYSAGVCVLSPTLRGYETVDPPDQKTYGDYETIWDGLGLIDWMFAPHFDSDHPESAMVDDEIAYYEERGIEYKALRDGEVIIVL